MTITIDSELDAPLQERAQSEGLSVSTFVERLVKADRPAMEGLETLALEGLNSGEPIEVSPGYWAAKHRLLDDRLRNFAAR